MKKYKITVNGKSYDVVVEEVALSDDNKAQLIAPVTKQATSSVEASVKPATTATPTTAKVTTEIIENATPIKASLPGTILSFNVSVGDSVKSGDVVLILEAMKMENEIVSTVDGVVKSINVEAGSSVSEGDILLQIG